MTSKRSQRRRRPQGGRPRGRRTHATSVLAQGVGAAPPKAWGSAPGATLRCWDAKLPHHLALPRAVGPYTVIRATRRVAVTDAVNILGTFQAGEAYGVAHMNHWSEVCMASSVAAGTAINAASNVKFETVDLSGLGPAATLTPSAFSVQILCPASLYTASGIVYAGVMNTQACIADRLDTWSEFAEKFVQFQNPRLLSSAKLALRGVQINSYPLNMAEVSKFTPLRKEGNEVTTYNESKSEPIGWAPIMIYNPDGAQLELLITTEYRVRFDLDHPASASHTHHAVASDSTWDSLTRQASALGNGVMDIADVVANTGMAIGRAITVGQKLGQLARALPAITG